ncbi:hypothetical protein D3C72_1266820 [compost metagenome]
MPAERIQALLSNRAQRGAGAGDLSQPLPYLPIQDTCQPLGIRAAIEHRARRAGKNGLFKLQDYLRIALLR